MLSWTPTTAADPTAAENEGQDARAERLYQMYLVHALGLRVLANGGFEGRT